MAHAGPKTVSGAEYLPIRLAALRIDTVTDFDLYLQTSADSELVLYRQKDLPFDESAKERLEEHRVEELYVPISQEGSYYTYLEENMGSILSDEKLEASEKMEILYDSAQQTVHDILDDPGAGDILPRSQTVVEHVVNFVFSEPTAFGNFLEVASFDYQTFTHSLNVFVYSLNVAQRLGYTDVDVLMEFGTGALLHDIGKSRVTLEILQEKGPLSDAQWVEIKKHPGWGYEILKDHGVTSKIILDVALSHHEKLNGTGYPNGIKGNEISRYVRMATICDIFDAVTTRRPYKGAIDSYPALKMMKDEMRDELDQECFATFVRMMAEAPGLVKR